MTLPEAKLAFERVFILQALIRSGGKRVRAAEILGISRKHLWEKIREHDIKPVEWQEPMVLRTDPR